MRPGQLFVLFLGLTAGCSAIEGPSASQVGCVVENDCPRGQSCLVGQCRVVVCQPNQLRCAGNTLESCDPTGQGFELRSICPAGCDEEANTCRLAVCAAHASRCYEGNVERCLADGSGWNMEQVCGEDGCEAGNCVTARAAVCAADATRCVGENVERCNDRLSGWVHTESCLFGCAGGACAEPVCDGGASRCDGPDLLVCKADRTEWAYRRTCDNGCSDGACQAACEAGANRCNGDGLESCQQGSFRFQQDCDFGCRAGACAAAACERGARQCAGEDLEACRPDQRGWLYMRTCEAGCDAEAGVCNAAPNEGRDCVAGVTRCNGQQVERCSNEGSWAFAEQCGAVCMAGACTACVPGAELCADNQPQRCSLDGAAFVDQGPVCEQACRSGACTACEPGLRRCQGDNIELCRRDGQAFEQLAACLTRCVEGACTLCNPGAIRCNGQTVERCSEGGAAWAEERQCNGQCRDGACQGEAVCVPGEVRCVGQNREVCAPGGAAWLVRESCMAVCAAGVCEGPACLPFSLSLAMARLPADGNSSTVVSSGLILDNEGTPVPDGSLFTVSVTGAAILAVDADAEVAGVQVRSLNGRIDFAVQAPAVENDVVPDAVTVRAAHAVAPRCAGSVALAFEAPALTTELGLDFTDVTQRDPAGSDVNFDHAAGRVLSGASDFGDGSDGDLRVNGTVDINTHRQPGRSYADAVNYSVTAIRAAGVTISKGQHASGIVRGDEVLLINLQGSLADHDSVGNYETLFVTDVNDYENTIAFSRPVAKAYGIDGANVSLSGQKIMLQRVPHYRAVTVSVDSTLTASVWNNAKNGVLYLRSSWGLIINGQVSMAAKRRGPNRYEYFSYNGQRYYYNSDQGLYYHSTRNIPLTEIYGANYYSAPPYRFCGASHATIGYCSGNPPGSNPLLSVYGDTQLAKIFSGAPGHYTGNNSELYSGGGVVVINAQSIELNGRISAGPGNTSAANCGSAGSIYLRAQEMNLGEDRVIAEGCEAGYGDGRIRIDAENLTGTTRPAAYEGELSSNNRLQTTDLSGVGNPISSVTLGTPTARSAGGTIAYQVTSGAVDAQQQLIWHAIEPGETIEFANPELGTALRLRVLFSRQRPGDLFLRSVTLRFTRAE